jgi:peroxiredoxin
MTVYPDEQAPALSLPTVGGGTFTLSEQSPTRFTFLVFYRGLHCPLCVMYLQELEENYGKALAAGIEIAAVSMDSLEKAQQTHDRVVAAAGSPGERLQLPIAYGLTEEQARAWGLYLSAARSGSNEPSVYSEPGHFAVQPDGNVFFASIQNAPFTRPRMEQMIMGLTYAAENNYPTRGTLTKATTLQN